MTDLPKIRIKELKADHPSINKILQQTWLLFLPGAKRTCASAGQALLNDLLEAGVLGLRHHQPDPKATKDPEQERTTFRIFLTGGQELFLLPKQLMMKIGTFA